MTLTDRIHDIAHHRTVQRCPRCGAPAHDRCVDQRVGQFTPVREVV